LEKFQVNFGHHYIENLFGVFCKFSGKGKIFLAKLLNFIDAIFYSEHSVFEKTHQFFFSRFFSFSKIPEPDDSLSKNKNLQILPQWQKI